MSIWAIVPVKPFMSAKSRLASVLQPEERVKLSREFFEHVLKVLSRVMAVSQTLVISRDSSALALAREHKAHTVTESGAPDLNAALRRATEVSQKFGARAVLILPSDLPLLSEKDVKQLLEDGTDPSVVIAPDRRRLGTNALFVRPPGSLKYAFGERSFEKHRAQAVQSGARVRICQLAGVALDIDVPDDLNAYQEIRRHQPRSLSR
jgi:2-phospho-L-lactate guanylyltransferase